MYRSLLILITSFISAFTSAADAAPLRLAVASNFLITAEQLASAFEEKTGHRVQISSGSTGKLYTQIRAGAPYDLFMAADSERPERLVNEGLADPQTLRTYAIGQLVIWSPKPGLDLSPDALLKNPPQRISTANPATAPYGRAAKEAMDRLGLNTLADQLVYGENIAQTYQLTYSGAAELGLIAHSLYRARPVGSIWPVPVQMHGPIKQQMVILKRTTNPELAKQWHSWVLSRGRTLIEAEGYLLEAKGD